MKRFLLAMSCFLLLFAGTACSNGVTEEVRPSLEAKDLLEEVEVHNIPLPAPLDDPSMEFSGLGWYGDTLILLPQFPERFAVDGIGRVFAIERQELLNYVNGTDLDLTARSVRFDDGGLSKSLAGWEGFESIAFLGDMVFLTIETRGGEPMMGYLARGHVLGDLEEIVLEDEPAAKLVPQAPNPNASDEAMLIFDGQVITIFEDNGADQNPDPHASVFDPESGAHNRLPFPDIPFRITDATAADAEGYFWVMNYHFPGDEHLASSTDPIKELYGEGKTHAENAPVERLLKLRIDQDGIHLTGEAPIYLELLPDNEARNWEGLAQLDDLGFLVVTDKFPGSILSFLPFLR